VPLSGPLVSTLPIPSDAIRWATTAAEAHVGRGQRAFGRRRTPKQNGRRRTAMRNGDVERQGEERPVPSEQHGDTTGGAREALASQLRPVVAAAVRGLGFDLESLDVQVAGRRKLVKVVVDADDGVELDLLSGASRAVSAALDSNDDLLGGPYTLEVTSPGVDRPLTRPRHWRRANLRLVRIRPHDGGVEVLVGGALRRVEYRTVAKAMVEVEFRQPPAAELQLLCRGSGRGRQEEKDAKEESR
jgi:ribosome maturation factor RimP